MTVRKVRGRRCRDGAVCVGFLVIGGLGCESCMQAIRGTHDSLNAPGERQIQHEPESGEQELLRLSKMDNEWAI